MRQKHLADDFLQRAKVCIVRIAGDGDLFRLRRSPLSDAEEMSETGGIAFDDRENRFEGPRRLFHVLFTREKQRVTQ